MTDKTKDLNCRAFIIEDEAQIKSREGNTKSEKVFNPSVILNLVEGDIEVLQQVTELFLDNLPKRLLEVQEAIHLGDGHQ